jgi:ATP-dependent Clp protease ATP-binding subunit ClpC
MDSLSQEVKDIIGFSKEIAEKSETYCITPCFILKAICTKDCIGKQILEKLTNLNDLLLEISKHTWSPIRSNNGFFLDEKSKEATQVAIEEAKISGFDQANTGHLLIGLIKCGGVTESILEDLRIDIENIRKEIMTYSTNKEVITENLDKFSKDLTNLAIQGKLDPVIGRENEIERLIQILSRRTKNNPILIGEPGVGKTAIAEGLAQRIVDKDVPVFLIKKRIVSLDLGLMVAGTKYRGQFEERMKAVMKEIIEAKNIILFLDEIHTLVGAGAAEGSIDASNMLKPPLSRGEIQVIGATTLKEHKNYIERDGALERRFQIINVSPPNKEETVKILIGLKPKYERHHNVVYNNEVIKQCVDLSDRYISDRYLPDKAIDVLDEAASYVRLKNLQIPAEIKNIQVRMLEAKDKKDQFIDKQKFEYAIEEKNLEEQLKIEFEKRVTDWHKNNTREALSVTINDITSVVSKWTGVPVFKMEENEARKLLRIEEDIHKRLIGQEEAVRVVCKAIKRSRTGVKDPNRPTGSFLFLGPTGVGKTELARCLADYLFSDRNSLIRVDMSEFSEQHTISRLIGSPPGYVGYNEGGELTEKVRRRPYSVILFDEIEKAHPYIFNVLLQVLDDGHLTSAEGRKVNFKNTVIIMTSNIAAKHIETKISLGFNKGRDDELKIHQDMKQVIMTEVSKVFNPEFLNRLDEIVVFHSLEKSDLEKIIDIMIQEINRNISEKKILVKISSEAKDWLIFNGYSHKYGARPLKRCLQSNIEDKIAEGLLEGDFKDGDTIIADVKDDKIIVVKENSYELVSV